MSKLVFVCGPHCGGKTSILKALYNTNRIDIRGSEIGKDLYYERKFLTEGQDHHFEMEVANRELERDFHYARGSGIVGVETWHPGNIAYAAVRNPSSVPALIEMAKTSPFIKEATGIWLRIPQDVIEERTQTFKDNKEWAGEFYSKIDLELEQILDSLNLLSNTVCINATRPFNEVMNDVSKYILPLQTEMVKN